MQNQKTKKSEENMVEKSTRYIDNFRKNVDILMSKHNYTIKETAELADISFDTFKTFLYDKGSKDCRLSTAVKLAKAFHISIDELVEADTLDKFELENLQAYRSLPHGSRRFIDWHIQNQKFIHTKHSNQKTANIMLPLNSGSGNLKVTSDYEFLDISNIGDDLLYKIFLGIKIPCLHYLPHYTEGDILLIANDRDAMRGENTILQIQGNLVITNRVVEDGVAKYYGLRGQKFAYSTEAEHIEILGYVAKIIRA